MKTRIEWIWYNILSVLGMLYVSENKDRIVIAPMMFLEFILLGLSYAVGLAWMVSGCGYHCYEKMSTIDAMLSFGKWEAILLAVVWIIILNCNKDDNFRSDGTAYFRTVFISYDDVLSLSDSYGIYRREYKKKEVEELASDLQNSINNIINDN